MTRWLAQWGLSQSPFTKEIGDAELWVPSSRQGAVDRLVETCRDRGHAILVGEPGVGKTCVLRALRHRLPQDGFRLTYCHNATLGRRDFYRHVCLALGLSPAATAAAVFYAISTHVSELGSDKVHPVLLIDEAHLLHQDVLEHLHILANYEWDSKALLSIVLVGLPETRQGLSIMDAWPALPLDRWEPTYLTLHRFTQIVGKIRLALAPEVNHWWHVPLYVSSQGLTTSSMPLQDRQLTLTLDFCAHRLVGHTSDKRSESFALEPMTVADFYARTPAAARQPERERADLAGAGRGGRPHALPAGPPACRLRPRSGRKAAPHPDQHRSRLQHASRQFRRQVQPGALLLGRVRSRRHALLGQAQPDPAGRQGHGARPIRTR